MINHNFYLLKNKFFLNELGVRNSFKNFDFDILLLRIKTLSDFKLLSNEVNGSFNKDLSILSF